MTGIFFACAGPPIVVLGLVAGENVTQPSSIKGPKTSENGMQMRNTRRQAFPRPKGNSSPLHSDCLRIGLTTTRDEWSADIGVNASPSSFLLASLNDNYGSCNRACAVRIVAVW